MIDPFGEDTPPDVAEAPPAVELRCSHCVKLLAELISPPYRVVCTRCRTVNTT